MPNNMHIIDRTLRVIVAVLIVVFYSMGQISGLAAIILGLVAVIFLVTSIIGYCPLYQLVGISTKGK
ncbi:MAG: DUF2892 domain-containing protein [bacterium]